MRERTQEAILKPITVLTHPLEKAAFNAIQRYVVNSVSVDKPPEGAAVAAGADEVAAGFYASVIGDVFVRFCGLLNLSKLLNNLKVRS